MKTNNPINKDKIMHYYFHRPATESVDYPGNIISMALIDVSHHGLKKLG
jgi:hypothetical protein